jgi:hypothetical protein
LRIENSISCHAWMIGKVKVEAPFEQDIRNVLRLSLHEEESILHTVGQQKESESQYSGGLRSTHSADACVSRALGGQIQVDSNCNR